MKDKVVVIPIIRGIETKQNEYLSPSPSVIENARIDKTGVIRKRFGLDSLNTEIRDKFGVVTGNISDGKYFYNYNNDLFINSSGSWYRYSDKRGSWEKRSDHELYDLQTVEESEDLPYEDGNFVDFGNGQRFAAIIDSILSTVEFVIFDEKGFQVASSQAYSLDPFNSNVSIETDGTDFYASFFSTSYQVNRFDIAMNQIGTFSQGSTATGPKVSSLSYSDNKVYVFIVDQDPVNISVMTFDRSLSNISGLTIIVSSGFISINLANIITEVTDSNYILAYSHTSQSLGKAEIVTFSGDFVTNTKVSQNYGAVISKFTNFQDSKFIASVDFEEVLVDLNFNMITKTKTFNNYVRSRVIESPYQLLDSAEGILIGARSILKKDYINISDSIEFNGVENIFGAKFLVNDGVKEMPLPFNEYPDYKETVSIGTGGGANGTFFYLLIYTTVDARGNLYQSAISNGYSVTYSSGKDALFRFYKPKLFSPSDFTNGVYVELYRRAENETSYKRVTSRSIDDSLTYDILDPLTDISAEKEIYSDSEVINDPAPPSSGGCFHNGRIFLIDATKRNRLIYSKYFTDNFGVSFPQLFNLVIEDNQDRESDYIRALQSMDSKLIIFKGNSILVVYGDGPSDSGSNIDYTNPDVISVDTGCSEPRSLILTSFGIFYKSKKGIWVINRALESSYVGAPVEEFNDLTISGVVHMDDLNEVRFSTREGRTLVFNYYYKQWTTFVGQSSEASVKFNGKYSYLMSSGKCEIEHSSFRDNGLFIARKVDSGWIRGAGAGSAQRIKRIGLIGDYVDDHNIKVTTYHDYEKFPWSEYTLVPEVDGYNNINKPAIDDYYKGANDGVYEYNIHIERQVGQSLKIVFEDVDTGSTEEGFRMASMSVKIAKKKGQHKLLNNKRF